jgi:hypothetical protein
MDKTALKVTLFFVFMLAAGLGFQVARWLF